MLCLYTIGVFLGLVRLGAGYNGQPDPQKEVAENIDVLLDEYLRTENSLWSVIRSSDKNQQSIEFQIYEKHSKFMGKNFGEIGLLRSVEWELPVENQTVISNIRIVNNTFQLGYELIRSGQYPMLPDYARDAINSLPNSVNAIKAATDEEFWLAVKNRSQYCRRHTTLILAESLVVNEVYKELVAALLKSYMVLQFAFMMSTANAVANLRINADNLRSELKISVAHLQDTAKELLRDSALSREIWACDVNETRKYSHVEITRFYQGFVANEINLNSRADCRLTCSDYLYTWHFNCKEGTYCANRGVDKRQSMCNGTVQNCMNIESELTICTAPEDSSRRYDYIRYGNGKVMGDGRKCPNRVTAKSWWEWFYKCDNCLCYCDAPGTPDKPVATDRYISLRAVVSDITDDKIVTGIAITKINHIIQLKIAQRKLLPKGVVDTESDPLYADPRPHWKTAELFHIDGQDVYVDDDYSVISWANRSVRLSSAIIDDDKRVLTGVRFRKFRNHIGLEIRATHFDFESGHLINIGKSEWIGGFRGQMTEQKIDRPDVPTNTVEKSIPFPDNNKFINFQPSDVEKDAAQTTVPFLDATPVEASVPLAGAGLYYKTQPGYGGFIAPKLIVFDFAKYLTPPSYTGNK